MGGPGAASGTALAGWSLVNLCGLEGRITARYGLVPRHGWRGALQQAVREIGRARALSETELMLASFHDPDLLRELAGALPSKQGGVPISTDAVHLLARRLRESSPPEAVTPPWRIWTACCSTGEETWGVAAMLLDELAGARALTVLGTDLSVAAIEQARRGEYELDAMRGIPREVLSKQGKQASSVWRASTRLREVVSFRHLAIQEVLAEGVPRTFDAIVFCNAARYLDAAALELAYQGFWAALEPHGVLLIGDDDPPPETSLFRTVEGCERVLSVCSHPLESCGETTTPDPHLLAQSGDETTAALRLADAAIRRAPTDGRGYLARGQALLKASRPAEALEDLERAAYLMSSDELAEYWCALAAHRCGQALDAHRRLVRVIHRLSSRHPEETLSDGATSVEELRVVAVALAQRAR